MRERGVRVQKYEGDDENISTITTGLVFFHSQMTTGGGGGGGRHLPTLPPLRIQNVHSPLIL